MTDYATALDEIRRHITDLVNDLEVWVDRAVNEPDARARRYASEAVDAIDGALRQLYEVRAVLIAEIRHDDDETAERADASIKYGISVRKYGG